MDSLIFFRDFSKVSIVLGETVILGLEVLAHGSFSFLRILASGIYFKCFLMKTMTMVDSVHLSNLFLCFYLAEFTVRFAPLQQELT